MLSLYPPPFNNTPSATTSPSATTPASQHPNPPIPLLLDGKDLPRILLEASVPLPQRQRRGGHLRLQLGTEIGGLEGAEEHADAVELGAVAGGDGDLDVDAGVMHVADGAREAEGEFLTGLRRGQEFEGEGDSVCHRCGVS